MIQFPDIYVSINVYLLQDINTQRWSLNNQYCMLDFPVVHHVSIGTYIQEILPIFMLEYGVYIILQFNLGTVEVLANIGCYISTW